MTDGNAKHPHQNMCQTHYINSTTKNHSDPKIPHSRAQPPQFGEKAQDIAPDDDTPSLDAKGKKRIEKIVGSSLHHARAVDNALSKALNSVSRKQSAPAELTEEWSNRILDYVATHPDAEVLHKASDMILKVHSDASHLNEDQAISSHGGFFFLGWKQPDNHPLRLNGCILAAVGLLKLVAASAAESKIGGLFCDAQDVTMMRLTLTEMGWPHPPTDACVDNSTACGAAKSTTKKQRSRAMNVRHFWTADQVNERNIRVLWAPGLENLADYFTKHHLASHHRKARPCCVNVPNSPACLQKAPAPRDLRGCVNPTMEACRTAVHHCLRQPPQRTHKWITGRCKRCGMGGGQTSPQWMRPIRTCLVS